MFSLFKATKESNRTKQRNMTDVAAVQEPRQGKFRQRSSESEDALGSLPLKVSMPSLPSLTPNDMIRAMSITLKPVESDIQFNVVDDSQVVRPGGFAIKTELPPHDKESLLVQTSTPSQVFNEKMISVLPLLSAGDEEKASSIVPTKVPGDISFTFLGDETEEINTYAKATVEELEHSLHASNDSAMVVLDQEKTIASFFGQAADDEKGGPTSNGTSSKPAVVDDDDYDDDFQPNESISKLEALLDNALDDEIGAFRDSFSDEELRRQAQRKAELDAALKDMANDEQRLSEEEMNGGNGGETKPRDSLMEFETLLDAAMSDDDFLDNALSDDEFEISFFDVGPPVDESKVNNKGATISTATNAKKRTSKKPSTVPKKPMMPTAGKSKATTKPPPTIQRKPRIPMSTTAKTTTSKSRSGATTTRPKPESLPRPQRTPVTRSSPKTSPRATTTAPYATRTNPKPKAIKGARARPKPEVSTPVPKPKPVGSHPKPELSTLQSRAKFTVKPKRSIIPSHPFVKKLERKRATADGDDDGAAPLDSPSKTAGVGVSILDQSMDDFAIAAKQQQGQPPRIAVETITEKSSSPSKIFESILMESTGRIGSYFSPRRSQTLPCASKYQINLHALRGACELCYHHLNSAEKADADAKGYHIRVVMCRGGCDHDCQVFPRDSTKGESPVRLCRTCFFNTHRDSYTPQKFEYNKRLIV
jgi:hypothetical protein